MNNIQINKKKKKTGGFKYIPAFNGGHTEIKKNIHAMALHVHTFNSYFDKWELLKI